MATAIEPATYWCHQCHTSVRPSSGNDVSCPLCQGGFIEEIENAPGIVFPAQRVDPEHPRDAPRTNAADGEGLPAGYHRFIAGGRNPPPLLQVLQAMSAILQQGRPEEAGQAQAAAAAAAAAGGDAQAPDAAAMDSLDRLLMHNLFGGMRGPGGGNIEVFFDNGTGNGPRRLPANIGDYFFGPGLDQLIQQLAENDPNRYGTPPASKSAIDAMPTITITNEHMGTDAAQCAVCKDEFDPGTQARQMPCKHLYHGDCILPWLQQHNSCPVCRFEMPSEEPAGGQTSVNSMQQQQQGQQQQGQQPQQQQPQQQQQQGGRAWRGSFQFPWPFSFRPSNSQQQQQQQQAGASGSAGNNTNNNNNSSSAGNSSNITDDLMRHDLPD